MAFFEKILQSISNPEEAKDPYRIVGNCFGFFGLQGGIGTSSIVLDLGYALAELGKRVCIVDCNPFSTFYFTKNKIVNQYTGLTPSIDARLINRNTPLKDCLIELAPTLRVLSFGEREYEKSIDIDLETFKSLFEEVKDRDNFDIVLMDIANIPYAESTVAALEACSTIYTLCDFSFDTISRLNKLRQMFSKISRRDMYFNNIVLTRESGGQSIAKSISENFPETTIITQIPYIPQYSSLALGNTNIQPLLTGKTSRQYSKALSVFSHEILEGFNQEDDLGVKDISLELIKQSKKGVQ